MPNVPDTTSTGVLASIWIKRAKLGPMDAVTEAVLDEKGIVGNADRGGQRQVTLLEAEVWAKHMSALDGALDPARRRANVMLQGCQLAGARGRILRIGDCRIAIRGETKPCERMDEALPGLRAEMFPNWGGGAFGQVIEGGTIRVGDVVSWDDVA
ncbi:MAG: sulfurase [Gemmatimonadetes bacterium]|nr:sulfurase [Gemmatimonadota bacterium]MCC6771355.1 sulfurase [Gemmatimonadaceae bacterium]